MAYQRYQTLQCATTGPSWDNLVRRAETRYFPGKKWQIIPIRNCIVLGSIHRAPDRREAATHRVELDQRVRSDIWLKGSSIIILARAREVLA